jgi:hypothetical protein
VGCGVRGAGCGVRGAGCGVCGVCAQALFPRPLLALFLTFLRETLLSPVPALCKQAQAALYAARAARARCSLFSVVVV